MKKMMQLRKKKNIKLLEYIWKVLLLKKKKIENNKTFHKKKNIKLLEYIWKVLLLKKKKNWKVWTRIGHVGVSEN